MREEFKILIAQLDADLSKFELEPNPLKRLGRCLERVEVAIADVPEREDFEIYYGDLGFLFIKELMPQLFRRLLYYHLLFDLEMNKTSSIKEEYNRYCENKLGEIRKWLCDNVGFLKYYYSQGFEEDESFVLSQKQGDIPDVLENYLKFPLHKISAARVGTVLAYEDFAKVLKDELEGQNNAVEPAEWKGSVTELAEQILGEHATEHTFVDGKPATQEYLVARAKSMYTNVSLKNFKMLASQVRARKVRASYHEKKIKLINARAEELLEKNDN